MKSKILIVEDESDIASALTARLKSEGYDVICADNGIDGLDIALEESFDLAILDIMLPGRNGFEIAQKIREKTDTSILMLSALDSEDSIIKGLDLGADDYVTKPFSTRELVARVNVRLRNRGSALLGTSSNIKETLVLDHFVLDANKHSVTIDDKEIRLTPKEFKILWTLCNRQDYVFSRQELVKNINSQASNTGGAVDVNKVNVRTVDSHVKGLRKKIGTKYIKTIHGLGYTFELSKDSQDKVSA